MQNINRIISFSFKVVFLILLFSLIFYQSCTPGKKETLRGPGPQIRVLLATIENKDSLHFSGSYILQSEEAQYELGKKNNDLYIQPLSDGLQLYNQNRNLLYRQYFPIILKPVAPASHFIYHGLRFYGSIYFQPASDHSVYLINKLELEEYLKGVVPAEIPSYNKDDFEAIKAQAICARTYAMKKMDENRDRFFDVVSTISDQVYAGVDRYAKLSNQAIEESKGVVITYESTLATVYYHSTCGGQLEASNNIFMGPRIPYLAGGQDAVGNKFSCTISPYFRWEETRTIDDFDRAFQTRYKKSLLGKEINDTLDVSLRIGILERDESGRVKSMTISYADTTVLLNGYEIRRFLSTPDNEYLRSNLFYFSQVNDSTITIYGGGYGHGVGMCQYGALFMAREGFKHYHIISKYFPQTKLLRKY
jgi:stage II sporulation protein D